MSEIEDAEHEVAHQAAQQKVGEAEIHEVEVRIEQARRRLALLDRLVKEIPVPAAPAPPASVPPLAPATPARPDQ